MCLAELGRFPVGKLLPLADLLLEKDSVNLLEAHVSDIELFHQLLQLDESGGMGVTDVCQLVKIVGGGKSHFGNGLVFKKILERGRNSHVVHAKEEGIGVGRELEQGHFVVLAALE